MSELKTKHRALPVIDLLFRLIIATLIGNAFAEIVDDGGEGAWLLFGVFVPLFLYVSYLIFLKKKLEAKKKTDA